MPVLSVAADEYYKHLLARRRAPKTARNQLLTLRQLVAVVGDINTATLGPRHVDALFTAYPHWAAGTRNNRLYDLIAFFKWCRFRRYMPLDSDPCYGWDKEKYAVPPKLRIPLSEWPALFEACQTPLETITLSSGLFLFLRGSEQQRIQMKHVHLDDLEIEVYRVKVKEWDIMPIPEELDPYLRNHLTHMTELGFVDKNHYLIYAMSQARAVKGTFGIAKNSNVPNPIKANGRPFKIVQGILERAGYPTYREGEHTLRRSAARAYFDSLVSQGYDGALRRVMSMLGHKDSKTTEEYLGLELDRLQRNADLKGKPMFPSVRNASIIPITRGRSGD